MDRTKTSRLLYAQNITAIFYKAKDCVLPTTAAEESSFDEALAHLVHLLPNKRDTITPFPGMKLRKGLKGCSRKQKRCRKKCLKQILNALQLMQRERFYDPPADDQIRYYLLIKKYIRAMINFFVARRCMLDREFPNKQYECISYSETLHNVDELAEINKYLADFSSFVSKMDITNGSAIKPLMGIQENYEAAPIIHGSKERNTLFYWHKFLLASLDIRSSQDAWFHPNSEEEQCYLRVLDLISSPSFWVRDKGEPVNVYSKELHFLFLDRIEREFKDLERHCMRTKMSILEKLLLVESWEYLVECFPKDPFDDVMAPDEEMRGRLTMRCQVSKEDLPEYIDSVERCRDLARIMFQLIDVHDFNCLVQNSLRSRNVFIGWDALHTLTLFKRGSFSPGNLFRERIILRNPQQNAEFEYREAKMDKCDHLEGDTENVKIEEDICYVDAKMKKLKRCVAQVECEKENVKTLEDIIEDLRRIGDSDTRLDKEEGVLMYKIWVNVASSVHFFFCAMAYEQQSYIIARGGLSGVREIGVKTRKMMMKNSTNGTELSDPQEKELEMDEMIWGLHHDMHIFSRILYHYEKGLREKLETQSGSKTKC